MSKLREVKWVNEHPVPKLSNVPFALVLNKRNDTKTFMSNDIRRVQGQ